MKDTTIPEYLFIRDLPGRAGGDDEMNMNEKNKIAHKIDDREESIKQHLLNVAELTKEFVKFYKIKAFINYF